MNALLRSDPQGIAFDAKGDIYVADSGNDVLRKISVSTGIITTVVGTGKSGYSGDGGLATMATLRTPSSIVIDAFQNIFFSDSGNRVIRKVNATGYISTVFGGGEGSFPNYGDNGPARRATLSKPSGIALDSFSNFYIVDLGLNVVRKVSFKTGNITLLAGNYRLGYGGDGSQATAASLDSPYGIALDSNQDIYISDTGNYVVRKVTISTGVITTVVGTGKYGYSGDGALATKAECTSLWGIAFDSSNNMYVADYYNQAVRVVTRSTGIITTFAETEFSIFSGPYGLALNKAQSKIYFTFESKVMSVSTTG